MRNRSGTFWSVAKEGVIFGPALLSSESVSLPGYYSPFIP